MSTHREIEEVYFGDIRRKSKMIKTIGETLREIQGERRIWVDAKFIDKWADELYYADYHMPEKILKETIKQMLREAGISIKK